MVNSWKDLTAEQYLKITKVKKNEDLLNLVFGKDIKSIPIKEWKNVDLSWLQKDPDRTDVRFYVHDGVQYGLVDFSNISMGEYVDISSLAEKWEQNIFSILAIMYRPVKWNSFKYKFKAWLGQKLMNGGILVKNTKITELGMKLFVNSDYKIQPYKGDEDLEREHIFRDMPADQFHSFILFFSTLLMQRTLSTLNFSDLPIRGKRVSPKKPKQSSASKAGDGTTSSTQ